MNKKAIINVNLAKNIGNHGVHQNDKEYNLQGFNDYKPYDGNINIDEIIDIDDKDILINNNPPENKFSVSSIPNETHVKLAVIQTRETFSFINSK